MSLPPLLSCSNRGVGSKAFELGFARKEPWGSELTSVPMGETASVNVIARIGKPSVARFVGAGAIPGTWFRVLTALRVTERERVGRNAQPSAAIIDATSV